jgi:hypothetical protein
MKILTWEGPRNPVGSGIVEIEIHLSSYIIGRIWNNFVSWDCWCGNLFLLCQKIYGRRAELRSCTAHPLESLA